MGRRKYLGQFEFMTLMAMMRLEDDAYGVAIARDIESASGRDVALASLVVQSDLPTDPRTSARAFSSPD